MKVALFVALLVFTVTVQAIPPNVTFSMCDDQRFCNKKTCQSASIQSSTCLADPNRNDTVQMFICDPKIHVCGSVMVYPDKNCTAASLIGTTAFPCNRCNPLKHEYIECTREGREMKATVYKCGDNACMNCSTEHVIPFFTCFPIMPKHPDDPMSYGSIIGTNMCTLVEKVKWRGTQGKCQGLPLTGEFIATDRCLIGSEITCDWP